MQFFMPMIPPTVTHQQKQVTVTKAGKPRFYEPADLKAARAKLTAHLAQHKPDAPFTGPVRCTVKWLFPLVAGKVHGQWKDTKPDTHNSNKLLFDVMTDLHFWQDDAQVCSEIIEKFYAEQPGIFIDIKELSA